MGRKRIEYDSGECDRNEVENIRKKKPTVLRAYTMYNEAHINALNGQESDEIVRERRLGSKDELRW